MTPETFIRKVCHDLRAPLRGMKEIPIWLEEDLETHLKPVPEPILELLQMMKMQASQLDTIVIGLSELAKLSRTSDRPEALVANLSDAQTWPGEIRYHFDVEKLPIEAAHLTLALHHLVDNAFKYGGGATHTAELSITQHIDGFHIALRDYGPGIDPKYFERIFEPLYSLKSRDECEAGGMGLAVVSKIASLYHGTANVFANDDGVGLTFELVLPALPT